MTRGELRQRMSQAEFLDWIGLFNLEAEEREKAEAMRQARAKARGR